MKCLKCGAELPEDAKFCSYCGDKIVMPSEQGDMGKEDISQIPSDEPTRVSLNRQEAPKSLTDKLKEKASAQWGKLSTYGKIATVSIAAFAMLLLVALLVGKTAAIIIAVFQIVLAIVAVFIHRGIIRLEEKQRWFKWLALVIAIMLTVLNVRSYSWNAESVDRSADKPVSDTSVVAAPDVAAEPDVPIAAGVPCGAAECLGQDYSVIRDTFSSAGFTNIKIEKMEDLKAADADKLDTIDLISVGGKTDFARDQEFKFEDEVLIRYHAYTKCNVTIHVDFVPNLIFSKYDVKLLMNGIEEGTLTHGENQDFELAVYPGECTLTFESTESSSVKGKVTLAVDCDIEAAYKISCYSDKVSVETLYEDRLTELAEGEAKSNVPASEYVHKNYEDVADALKALGFTNIKYEVLYDIVYGWTEDGEVESVSIAGKTDFNRGEVFSADDEIVITYHMPEDDNPSNIAMEKEADAYNGMHYIEVEQLFKDMGFTNVELSEVTTESTSYTEGEVFLVEIGGRSFEAGDKFKPDKKVNIKYYHVEEPEEIITIDNNSDFAAILTAEYLDPEKQAAFVSTYKGKIVEFDCVVKVLTQNERNERQYSYVLVPGEDEDNYNVAMFYLENKNMFDFKWDSATRPEYLTIGSKIRIRAEVVSGDDPLFIYLKPVRTWGR